MRQKVVARFMCEDRIVKGYTHDFFLTKEELKTLITTYEGQIIRAQRMFSGD